MTRREISNTGMGMGAAYLLTMLGRAQSVAEAAAAARSPLAPRDIFPARRST